MRDLTDLFLAVHDEGSSITELQAGENRSDTLGHVQIEYDMKVAKIRARLATFPSAYTPGAPVAGDWVYEACRIAAIIYASAIIMKVPFSVAAEPGRSILLSDTSSIANPITGGHLLSTRLAEALYEVLERSNMQNIWGDMSGVLYWVCLVGAAAARTPASIKMSQMPTSRSEAYAIWVRRCLIMSSTRAMIVLIFKHPLPIIHAQKRMLKVQALITNSGQLHLP